MIKLKDLLAENSKSKYDFGAVMLFFEFPEMKEIHKKIRKSDVYTEDGDKIYGLEDEPHVTLLYGLHDTVDEKAIKSCIQQFSFSSCRIHNPSIFSNEKYDVLKFDVTGQNLYIANRELRRFEHTSSFPKYHPHMTIGYLKSGTGNEYTEKLRGCDYVIRPTKAVFSQPSGKKVDIDLILV